MLIVTTWAAVLMGGLRVCGASPLLYFMVIAFVAGALRGAGDLVQGSASDQGIHVDRRVPAAVAIARRVVLL